MSWIDTIGSVTVVVALLALNVRAFRADSRHLSFETKMIMGVSWVIIFGIVAFVIDRWHA